MGSGCRYRVWAVGVGIGCGQWVWPQSCPGPTAACITNTAAVATALM